jgi:hypothetical protein
MSDDEADETHGFLMSIGYAATTLRRMLHHEPTADPRLIRAAMVLIMGAYDQPHAQRIIGTLTLWEASDTPHTREEAIAHLRTLVQPSEAKR